MACEAPNRRRSSLVTSAVSTTAKIDPRKSSFQLLAHSDRLGLAAPMSAVCGKAGLGPAVNVADPSVVA
jgi:hypothetical protein